MLQAAAACDKSAKLLTHRIESQKGSASVGSANDLKYKAELEEFSLSRYESATEILKKNNSPNEILDAPDSYRIAEKKEQAQELYNRLAREFKLTEAGTNYCYAQLFTLQEKQDEARSYYRKMAEEYKKVAELKMGSGSASWHDWYLTAQSYRGANDFQETMKAEDIAALMYVQENPMIITDSAPSVSAATPATSKEDSKEAAE